MQRIRAAFTLHTFILIIASLFFAIQKKFLSLSVT